MFAGLVVLPAAVSTRFDAKPTLAADPVFAAIEAHKRAYDELAVHIVREDQLCDAIPEDRRRSDHYECMEGNPDWKNLADAEAFLMGQGFWLVADSCDWTNTAHDDAGVYPVEDDGVAKAFRVEIKRREGNAIACGHACGSYGSRLFRD
jgi:hypothetical protein